MQMNRWTQLTSKLSSTNYYLNHLICCLRRLLNPIYTLEKRGRRDFRLPECHYSVSSRHYLCIQHIKCYSMQSVSSHLYVKTLKIGLFQYPIPFFNQCASTQKQYQYHWCLYVMLIIIFSSVREILEICFSCFSFWPWNRIINTATSLMY